MFAFMHRTSLTSVAVVALLSGSRLGAQQQTEQTNARACPEVPADTSAWVTTTDRDVGIEIKHPADYREIHMGSRSDTAGLEMALWRHAVSRIEVHEPRGFWSNDKPNLSVAPCLVRMRSAILALHIERTLRRLWSGRDSVYFVAKGFLKPPGKPQMVVDLGAPDSTGLLEQMAILRTIRFVHDP